MKTKLEAKVDGYCKGCRHWHWPKADTVIGRCLRHAPRPAMLGELTTDRRAAVWPETRIDDRCGQWEAR